MLRIAAMSAAIFAFCSLAFAADDSSVLLERQRGYFDAIVRRDYKAVEATLAENYSATYALGIIDKKKEMEDVKNFPLAAFDISQPKVIFLSGQIATVSFKLHVKVVVEGKDFFEDDYLSCIWQKRKKDWIMVGQSAVKVKAEGQ
jgi:hypothetical protein